MTEYALPKPPPPAELSIRTKVAKDWKAIEKKIAANKIAKIEILQISLKLADAERVYEEGRSDPRYDWTHDLSSARYMHEGMLKWAEVNAEYHLYSAEYWREVTRRQWNVASEYTLSGVNAVLFFNGGVALGCLGG